MKHANRDVFWGKILLFGEYSIIYGSSAVTIPFTTYSGKLQFIGESEPETEFARKSNDQLKKLLPYLDQPIISSNHYFPLDIPGLRSDIGKGLYFDSNIPDGYGAGSSGALVAALFYRYSRDGKNTRNSNDPGIFIKIRDVLSLMESYFHGDSSGLDPLSSLLARPLLIESGNNISFIDFESLTFLKDHRIFLIDTQQTRNTKPLVDWFRKKVLDNDLDIELLIALNNQIIKAVMNHNMLFFSHFINQLSLFQLENMQPMIPGGLSALWLQGIETGNWTLKLCGSGGGGYILGFTHDFDGTEGVFKNAGYEIIML